jgi:hypothetical protein
MQPQEFEALCESVFGTYWRRPASRALGRDPKMMRRYATGDTVIPDDVAQRLRSIAEIGRAGEVVKAVLLEVYAAPARHTVKRGAHEQAHHAAAQIVDKLNRAGLLGSMEE